MLDNFYQDNELYLDFLQIEKNEIALKNNKIDIPNFLKLVEKKFRNLARSLHPDFGGDEKKFQFLLECKSKLLSTNEKNSSFKLNIQNYDDKFDGQNIRAQLGNQLFELISSWSDELNIKPIHKPKNNEDDYEWIFNILDTDKKLSLNILALNDDLAQLANQLHNDDSLSVCVCLFILSKKLTPTKNMYDGSVSLKFNDLIIIESSDAKEISSYFSESSNLKIDLDKIKIDNFTSKESEIKTMKPEEAEQYDKSLFEKLMNMKIFDTQYDETAADFIDKL
jgi:hypothetical protein